MQLLDLVLPPRLPVPLKPFRHCLILYCATNMARPAWLVSAGVYRAGFARQPGCASLCRRVALALRRCASAGRDRRVARDDVIMNTGILI
jgi:hypothetical protein